MKVALNEYLNRLKNTYPSFVRFGEGDSELSKQERNYKLELVTLFKENNEILLKELPQDETSQVNIGSDLINLFTRKLIDGGSQNLVGWRYWGPLTKLTASGKASFARLSSDLIYGNDQLSPRIDRFVSGLRDLLGDSIFDSGWSAMSRSITSFLLMLSDPSQHVIIKTQEFNRALKSFNGDKLANNPLSGLEYLRIQKFLIDLFQSMKEEGLNPRDLIDVQTLIWVGDPTNYKNDTPFNYWTLGAMWGSDDMTTVFVKEGRWENGYSDKYLDKVNSVKTGDRVAIKTVFTQKHNLPFNNHGQTVSCMKVKAVGTVTDNLGDGRNLTVKWDENFESTTIYLYTYWTTIDRVEDKLSIPWIFDSVPQPILDLDEFYKQGSIEKEQQIANQTLGNLDDVNDSEDIVSADSAAIVGKPINKIFFGPPGCGKTYELNNLKSKYSSEDGKRYEFVTFHPSMSYEEFVEGLRPITDEKTKELKYEVKPGIFRQISDLAKQNPHQRYALFIDEINRANISKVFGELITLIEIDKRTQPDNSNIGLRLTLPYSRETFSVPINLDIYGTMNSADRSIALMDIALRRRFQFEEIGPNENLLSEDLEGINLQSLLATLNERIELLLDRDHRIGHAYFINVDDLDSLNNVFLNQILPLLAEYFHDDWSQIGMILTKRELGKSEFLITEELDPAKIFGKCWDARSKRGREIFFRNRLKKEFTKEFYLGLLS